MFRVTQATARAVIITALIGSLAQWGLCADLGLRLASTPPTQGEYAPIATGYPTQPSEMAATISVLGALGLDALIVEPSVAVDAGPLVSPAGSPQGGAERARLEAILGAADEAGLKVYLEGFQAQDRTGDIAAEATAIAAALSATLEALGQHSSLAGFIWRSPVPRPVEGTPLPADIHAAADAWITAVSGLVTQCGSVCTQAGRTFVIATDSVPLLAAAVPSLPDGVEVWRTAPDLRDPSLEPQRAALEAGIHGLRGGVWLDWEVPHGAGVSRGVCMALAAGCGTVIAGDVSLALHTGGIVGEDLVAQLAAFADAAPEQTSSRLAPPYSDAILLVEPLTVLTEWLAPPTDRRPDQVIGSLVLLNEAGRSVSIALAPPSEIPASPRVAIGTAPVSPGDASLRGGIQGEDPPPSGPRSRRENSTAVEGEQPRDDETVTVYAPPRPAPALVLCNAARATDAYLDALFESTDRGFTSVVYADVATEDLYGGARPAESRDRQDARLPMERSRPFRAPVSRVTVMTDLLGTTTRSGRELEAAAAEGQWIYRGKARPDCLLLAEWFEPSAPAFVASPRGAGRVLVYNGAPGLSRVNLFGHVLTHVGIPVTRPIEVDPEDDVREEPEGLGRHGLVPNFPYEKPIPVQVIPPPSIDPTLLTAETDSSYDAYVVGSGGALYAYGYRAPRSGDFRDLGGIETFMGPWDMIAVRGDAYLTTCRETRLPEDVDAHIYDAVSSEFTHVVYRRNGTRTICTAPGLYLLTGRMSDHALVKTGNARVLRAHRVVAEDGLLIEVDRPALLEIALDPEVFAGCQADVSLVESDAQGYVNLGPCQWWVTWNDRLFVDVLGRVPVLVRFAPAREELAQATATVEPGDNALPVVMDGEPAILLDRYANATALLTFEHWGRPEDTNTLSIVGVQGSLYGEGERGSDATAKLRITVNGTEVYHSEVPYRTYRGDGVRQEWSAVAIPVPKEALRRGHNSVVVENGGPNGVAIASATIRFERSAEE